MSPKFAVSFLLASMLLLIFSTLASASPRGPQSYPPLVGELHPDFSALDQDGQPFNLFEERGKPVVLHICAVWCQPCRESATVEGDLVAQLDAELGADGWLLIDVLFQDTNANPSDQADAQAWRKILGTPATTVHADNSATADVYLLGEQIAIIPLFIVLDTDSRVTGLVEGFDNSTMDTLADLVRNSRDPQVFADGFEVDPER